MSTPEMMFVFPSAGMNGSADPVSLALQAYAVGTNVRLDQKKIRTRYGWRAVRIECGDPDVVKAWRTLNTQGATFFNPAKGQGALVFGRDEGSIVEVAGGRRFHLVPSGSGLSTVATLSEITGATPATESDHLAWLGQAECYVVHGNGEAPTWYWDGASDAQYSPGFNLTNKEKSMIPDRVTAVCYANARLHVVVDANKIYVSDPLHFTNLSSPQNILNFTEQVYWATGQYFSPPSSMGNILGLAVLPLQDTQHGHGAVFAFCEDGIFSLDTSAYPRSSWATQALTKTALLRTGGVGPYALDSVDGDIVFRSRSGIQTLRSARAEALTEGDPYQPISIEVQNLMRGDRDADLRFCSLVNWPRQHRMLCTVYPIVNLRNRFHRGAVVMNWFPAVGAEKPPPAWEGLCTLPPELGCIVQMICGIFAGKERLFALTWNEATGRKLLVEMVETIEEDILEDGTRSPISCQMVTRAASKEEPFKVKAYTNGRIFWNNVTTDLQFGVWYRTDRQDWTLWRGGKIELPSSDGLSDPTMRNVESILGNPAAPPLENSRWIQLLIRWRGAATIESVRLNADASKTPDDRECGIIQPAQCGVTTDFDAFEYAGQFRWETTLPE